MSLDLQKGAGIEMKRRRQTFHATSTGTYDSSSSSQVRIEINVDKEVMDFETGYLCFDMVATGTGTTDGDTVDVNPWAASCWIRDLRVYDRAGREIGEQVRQYNGLARKQMELLGNEGVNANYLDALEGASGLQVTVADTGTAGTYSTTSKEFAHKLITHIFDIKSYFPAHLLGGLILEIDMESATNVGYTSEVDEDITSYSVGNVRYVCDLVTLKPDAEASLRSQIASGGLEVHYDSFMNHSQAVAALSRSQRFDLGIANGHVKSIQSFQVLDSARNASNEEYWSAFAQNNLSSYRFRLGSEYLTEKDVQISSTRQAEYLIEYLKSENLDSHDLIHFYGDSALSLSTFFTIGQKVEVSKDPDVASGRRDFQSNKIELELVYSADPAAGTLYTHINLDKVLVILPGREFKNVN